MAFSEKSPPTHPVPIPKLYLLIFSCDSFQTYTYICKTLQT